MLNIPSRRGMAALTQAVNAVVPAPALGFARRLRDDRISILQSTAQGIGEHVVTDDHVPAALLPSEGPPQYAIVSALSSTQHDPTTWLLSQAGVEHVVSLAVPRHDLRARFWVGTSASHPLTAEHVERLQPVAAAASDLLDPRIGPEDLLARLQRLEMTADLLPALLNDLDVRDVFQRLSATVQRALPHDLLTVHLFSDDLSQAAIFARSDGAPQLGPMLPHPYPPHVLRAWAFDIVDDLTLREGARQLVQAGARSALRIPIRFDGREIGGLAILSFELAKYSSDDVIVGRRLADCVGIGLSHYRMAEENRRAAVLRERTSNLEMLDELLATLSGVLDIREVFDRVSAVAQRVLPHDALSIAESIEEGTRVRVHASHGLGNLPVPFDYPAPERSMISEPWQFRLIDDVRNLPQFATHPGTMAGMRSMLFNAIRFEGRLFGGLNFYSKTPGHFVQDDVLVARRITDHVALAISHWRLAEEVRRNEELRARTTSIELLDELLATLIDSGDFKDVFGRLSAIARKVLPHDASALMARLPDGVHARVVASMGTVATLGDIVDVPKDLVDNPNWEQDIFDDLSRLNTVPYVALAAAGYRSLLRVPIRLDKRFAGALVFFANAVGAYKHSDILIARRIADRLTAIVARNRESEASQRADEASSRAVKLEARVKALTEELDARTGYRRVVGESREWRQVLKQAAQVAATDTTVLLLGESGTGKEVVARFLHRGSSRNGGPFIALNCAALPEQLLEAELFGYERGAYTGATQSKPGQLEQAAGGTLFLDEVAEMSPAAQAKFLRVLQEREFQRLGGTRVLRTDARVVAATNRDLQRAIANNQFREDLYYRLNVFAIRLPALRDRRDDILPLSDAFLGEIGKNLGRPPAGISRDARELLIGYHWPGNVRELRNLLERAAILCDGGLITTEHLGLSVPAPVAQRPVLPPSSRTAAVDVEAPRAAAERAVPAGDLATVERAMIEEALQSARFNKSRAAKALGLTRHQLYIRMRKHGLE